MWRWEKLHFSLLFLTSPASVTSFSAVIHTQIFSYRICECQLRAQCPQPRGLSSLVERCWNGKVQGGLGRDLTSATWVKHRCLL